MADATEPAASTEAGNASLAATRNARLVGSSSTSRSRGVMGIMGAMARGVPHLSATAPRRASATIRGLPHAARRHVARIDQTPFPADILDLSHDGRGVARREAGHPNAGKTVFIAGALPGERVMAKQTSRSRHFDEADTVEVLQASPDRVEPRCAHFGVCGGCALQHLEESKQILAKQRVLLENFERIGHVTPQAVLPPLTGGAWYYRRKGRFSVRRVEKKD